MKQFLLLLFFLAISSMYSLSAQLFHYGDSVEVSMLTCEPGDAVYARFGHTALRIKDNMGRDMSYNYGIFDFRTSNFYWKFVRGQTDYLLGIYPTEYFLEEYTDRGSTVWEQVLDLTPDEKRELIRLLNENYLPENRMYRYNFVFDNCATRPKVMIQNALQGDLSYRSAYSSETYRQLLDRYISNDAWLSLGINIVFGKEAERTVDQGGAEFLPELLRNDLQHAVVIRDSTDQQPRSLVSDIRTIVGPFNEEPVFTPWWQHPLLFSSLWLLWGLILTLRKHKRSRQSKGFDTVLYGFTGLAGLVIFLLSFFSAHPLVASNVNLLWLNPLILIPAFLIWKRKGTKFLLFCHLLNLLLMLIAAVIIALQIQVVPVAALPLMLLLIIRTVRRVRRLLKSLLVTSGKGYKWKR